MIPKWPTPSGKTENGAKKTCTAKLRATDTFKACKRVLRNRFNIKAAVEQCVADVLVRLALFSFYVFDMMDLVSALPLKLIFDYKIM